MAGPVSEGSGHTVARRLTETDLALVDAVQVNPRASWEVIGQVLGTSPAAAARRWRALQSDGRAWTSITMGPALSRGAVVQLACRGDDADEVVARLCELPQAFTVGRTTGDFDVWALLSALTPAALAHTVLDVLAALAPTARVRSHAYFRVHGGPRWRLGVLERGQADRLRGAARRPLRREAPTGLDRRIFTALGDDGRRSWTSVAHELGLAPQSVRRHVERLERRGLATFRADVARPLAGWPLAGLMWLAVDDAALSAVSHDLGAWSETRFCASLASPTDLLLVVGLHDVDHLNDLMHRLARTHPGVRVVDRQLLLRFAKVAGRLLDRDGRSVRVIPVDPWAGDPAIDSATW